MKSLTEIFSDEQSKLMDASKTSMAEKKEVVKLTNRDWLIGLAQFYVEQNPSKLGGINAGPRAIGPAPQS